MIYNSEIHSEELDSPFLVENFEHKEYSGNHFIYFQIPIFDVVNRFQTLILDLE